MIAVLSRRPMGGWRRPQGSRCGHDASSVTGVGGRAGGEVGGQGSPRSGSCPRPGSGLRAVRTQPAAAGRGARSVVRNDNHRGRHQRWRGVAGRAAPAGESPLEHLGRPRRGTRRRALAQIPAALRARDTGGQIAVLVSPRSSPPTSPLRGRAVRQSVAGALRHPHPPRPHPDEGVNTRVPGPGSPRGREGGSDRTPRRRRGHRRGGHVVVARRHDADPTQGIEPAPGSRLRIPERRRPARERDPHHRPRRPPAPPPRSPRSA